MYSDDIKLKFIELRAQARTIDSISSELNVSRRTLTTWNREFADDIADLRAVEREALREKLLGSTHDWMKNELDHYKRLDAEFARREFKYSPTESVFRMRAESRKTIEKFLFAESPLDHPHSDGARTSGAKGSPLPRGEGTGEGQTGSSLPAERYRTVQLHQKGTTEAAPLEPSQISNVKSSIVSDPASASNPPSASEIDIRNSNFDIPRSGASPVKSVVNPPPAPELEIRTSSFDVPRSGASSVKSVVNPPSASEIDIRTSSFDIPHSGASSVPSVANPQLENPKSTMEDESTVIGPNDSVRSLLEKYGIKVPAGPNIRLVRP